MEIKIVKESITKRELETLARQQFGNVIKAAVDIEQEIIAVGGELHADCEVALVEQAGSKREYIWGINLYHEQSDDEEWIEFDSLINIKPQYGNRSRNVEDLAVRKKIIGVVNKLVSK